MSDPRSDLPPDLAWLEWLEGFGDQELWGVSFWVGGIVLALLFTAGILVLGAWLERRHDRALAAMEVRAACVRLFTGKPPADVRGTPQLVQAAIVMAPAPLGRIMILIRRIIGGRVITRQRDLQRTRRLALLRLRQQAHAMGAGVVAGIEFCQIGLNRNRFALLATGTALIGADPAPDRQVTEAVGAEPPRQRRELLLALAILVIAAAVSTEIEYLLDPFFGDYLGDYLGDFWKRQILRDR